MAFELAGPADETLLRQAIREVIERNATFCMIVSDGLSERIFYFAIGGVRVIATGQRRSPTVGETLLARGDLDLDAYNRVIETVAGDDRRFGEAAVHLGVVSDEALQSAVEGILRDELLDTFFWDGSELVLTEGQPPKSFYEGRYQTVHAATDVPKFLGDIIERVDVWRDTVPRIPSGREVFELTEKGAAEPPGRWARLLGLLDGTRTAADAIEKSASHRVAAFEFLMLAMKDGKVRRTVGSAAQKASREQLVREIEQLEQALKVRVDSRIVRVRLARALELTGENSRAAAHWRTLGDESRRVNELDRALQSYAEAVRVLPTDFATRELVIEIYRHRKDFAQVVAHGRPLADLFVKHNLLNRAKHLLLQLVGLQPADAQLRRLLVFVLIGLGERDLALRHLRELAKMLEDRKAPVGELKDVYVRILALDPRDKAARARFDQITGVAAARRAVKMTVGCACLALAGVVTWWGYESRARRAANDAVAVARQQVAARDLAAARSTLAEASKSYRFSRASRHIDGFLREVERLQREEQERIRRREAMLAVVGGDDRESVEKSAGLLAEEARRAIAEGRTVDGHRILRELFSSHPDSDAARKAVYPLSVTVLPRDARVIVNGVPQGQGSVVVEYTPSAKTTVEIEAPGFEGVRKTLEGILDPEIRISLHRPVLWTYGLEAPCDAPPAAADDMVYAAGRDRFLTAITASEGRAVWRVALGLYGDCAVSPVVAGDLVIAATTAGEVWACDRMTGEVKWRKSLGAGVDDPLAWTGGLLVAVTSDGGVHALAADGGLRWKLPARSAVGGVAEIAPGTLGWVDAKGAFVVASTADGKPAPRATGAGVLRGTPSAAGEDRVWAYSEDDALRLFSSQSGTALRRFLMPRALSDHAPPVSGDCAWGVGADGSVAAFRAGGETAFRRRLDEAPGGPCAVSGDVLFYPGAKGTLHVLDAATGELSWTYDAKARISARPVVGRDAVIVAAGNGVLHCLAK
ncbi:MAG: Outer membrane protein assembly factor BamB [Planctomycetes bacterium]|nr:Outer membrane protein assembly factor BamB [Planctomycetota bacterium]